MSHGILRQFAHGGNSCLNPCLFSVPASKCLSKNQPTVPEYVTMATTHWVRDPCFFARLCLHTMLYSPNSSGTSGHSWPPSGTFPTYFHLPTPEPEDIFVSNCSDPSGKQLATLVGPTDCWPYGWPGLTDNNLGGKSLHFRYGQLVSYGDTSPFLIYGKFANYWKDLGGIESGFGYPIADPQFLPDGSICIIFQGGHIHQPSVSRDPEA